MIYYSVSVFNTYVIPTTAISRSEGLEDILVVTAANL